jgi:FAD/FMN-containing dehydrogenase
MIAFIDPNNSANKNAQLFRNLHRAFKSAAKAERKAQLAAERAQKAFGKIVEIAQSLGGTASGEHGIGSIKAGFVANEISSTVVELQRAVKKVFDPNSILNPGKKIP